MAMRVGANKTKQELNISLEPQSNYIIHPELIELFEDDAKLVRATKDGSAISIYDVINVVLPTNHVISFMLRHKLNITYGYFQFNGSGQRPTPVIYIEELPQLIKYLLANARLSTSYIREWSQKLKCDSDYVWYMSFQEIYNKNTVSYKQVSYRHVSC